ncbi:DUF1624 domain-containing protein [Planctobacterium marinum]|uniref:Heparan-alpha-glucosaminide N-acetyltransferase catalytic domain-containing protein n=1 Tax=Planctobacterium marinum TaxID=1631968 RepID=A0AA48I0G7_9ALTE|nr:hypothetical protein MACH26_35110 [Planctobacterium marinum]
MQQRIPAIDQLRGLVIVLMAIDHVRDFFSPFPWQPEDLTQTSPELFLTRWITHFCAPVFILLTGISAFLYEQKVSSKSELRHFLITRGIWLVFIELVVVNASWKFGFPAWYFVQVIWAIGVSMLFLALFTWLPRNVTLVFGVLMICTHNLADGINASQFGELSWLWHVLHQPGWIPFNEQGAGVYIAYPLVPWIGVMLVGYGISPWLTSDAAQFKQRSFKLGLGILLAFIVVRLLNVYGDPVPWSEQERGGIFTLLSILNTQKYPPSLSYLLMTLGPTLMLMSVMHRLPEAINSALLTFGRVPFFYYVLHLPLIHFLALLFFIPTLGWQVGWQLGGSGALPEGYEPSLLRLYLAWAFVTLVMFYLCKWYVGVKQRHNHWLLKYL